MILSICWSLWARSHLVCCQIRSPGLKSQVLEVIVKKDSRGRKAIEYLIHFQGWNSSWDRCVSEDFVLKDTEENRQLQKDLAEKAHLQLIQCQRYFARKERKKRKLKLVDKISESLEKKSREDSEEGSSHHGDSDDMSSSEGMSDDEPEERVLLDLSDVLKRRLEDDHELVTNRGKLVHLPAVPNVVTILEGYLKHCAVSQLCGSSEKKQRHQNSKPKDLDRIFRSINVCKEVVDGIRIYFDFTLSGLLLYNEERTQYEQSKKLLPAVSTKKEIFFPEIKEEDLSETNHVDESNLPPRHRPDKIPRATPRPPIKTEEGEGGIKRILRSHKPEANESSSICPADDSKATDSKAEVRNSLDGTRKPVPKASHAGVNRDKLGNDFQSYVKLEHCGNLLQNNVPSIASTSSRCSSPTMNAPPSTVSLTSVPPSPRRNAFLSKILSWKIVPDSLYHDIPVPPSLLYGAVHLTRLFVKLPDLLYATNMADRKLKVILRHLDNFLEYLEEHGEWFGEDYYDDNPESG